MKELLEQIVEYYLDDPGAVIGIGTIGAASVIWLAYQVYDASIDSLKKVTGDYFPWLNKL